MYWQDLSYPTRFAVKYTLFGLIILGLWLCLDAVENYFSNDVLTSLIGFLFPIAGVLALIGFGPAWFFIMLDLGLRGQPASPDYVLASQLAGIILQIIYSFIVGRWIGRERQKARESKVSGVTLRQN